MGLGVLIGIQGSDERLRPDEDPSSCHGDKPAAVLFFILGGCPAANAAIPEMNRIVADYGPKGVRFTFLHVDPEMTLADMEVHTKDFALTAPAIVDAKHRWVAKSGVKISPEAAVFLPDGSIAYRGRINDLYIGLGSKRQVITTHDLRRALDAILAGEKEIPPPSGGAVGCYIADLAPKS